MSGAAFRMAGASGIRVTISELTPADAKRFAADLARLRTGAGQSAV